jgi:hypothetical protein
MKQYLRNPEPHALARIKRGSLILGFALAFAFSPVCGHAQNAQSGQIRFAAQASPLPGSYTLNVMGANTLALIIKSELHDKAVITASITNEAGTKMADGKELTLSPSVSYIFDISKLPVGKYVLLLTGNGVLEAPQEISFSKDDNK